MIKMSTEVKDLFEALANAQAEFEHVDKGSTVNMELKSGRKVNYSYAELCDVQDALKEPFKKHGLMYSQFPLTIDGKTYLETLIGHKSGQWMSGSMPLDIAGKSPQDIGGLITYFRRYALSAAAGVTQSDDDANQVTGNQATIKPKAASKPPVPVKGPDGLYLFKCGKYFGQKITEVNKDHLANYADFLLSSSKEKNKPLTGDWAEMVQEIQKHLSVEQK